MPGNGRAQPTREQLEDLLREARRQELESLATANRIYETASQAEAERAYAEHQHWVDEIARLERELSDLDLPRESILDELDADSGHAAMLAGMGETGEGQTTEQAYAEAGRRNRRVLLALAGAGSLLAIAILAWMAWQQQGQPAASASPTPTSPGPQVTPSVGSSATPGAPPTPAPPTVIVPTPLPLTERPATGFSYGVASFLRVSGDCPIAGEFRASYLLEATDGDAVLTQLGINHVTYGTLTRTGPSSGELIASAEGQTYEATVSGNVVRGTHVYTGGGCDDAYDFSIVLDRPFLAPPPFGTAPASFHFLDDEGEELIAVPESRGVNLQIRPIVGVDLDLSQRLPILLRLQSGDDTLWESTLDGTEPLPVPPDALAALLDPTLQPVLVATSSGRDLIAVYAPRDIDWELAWIAELVLTP